MKRVHRVKLIKPMETTPVTAATTDLTEALEKQEDWSPPTSHTGNILANSKSQTLRDNNNYGNQRKPCKSLRRGERTEAH